MNIEKYIKEVFIGNDGLKVTLVDDSEHLLSQDSMSKFLLEKYIKENIDSDFMNIHSALLRVLEIAKNLLNDIMYEENWRVYNYEDYKQWNEELKEIERIFRK